MYLSSLYLRHLRSAIQKYQLIFLFFFYIVFYNFWEAIYIISFFLLSLSFSSSLVWFKLPQPIKKDTFKNIFRSIKIYIYDKSTKKKSLSTNDTGLIGYPIHERSPDQSITVFHFLSLIFSSNSLHSTILLFQNNKKKNPKIPCSEFTRNFTT